MDVYTANSLSIYIEILYETNQKILKLYLDSQNKDIFNYDKYIFDIVHNIFRLVPVRTSKDKKEILPQKRDGLYTLKNEISYFESSMDDVIENNKNALCNLKKIRNKFEHIPHYVYRTSIVYNCVNFHLDDYLVYTAKSENDIIHINIDDILKLLIEMNSLFSKIQNDIIKYAVKTNKTDYPYHKRLSRFRFDEFNQVYSCKFATLPEKLLLQF